MKEKEPEQVNESDLHFTIIGFLFRVVPPKDTEFKLSDNVKSVVEQYPTLDRLDQQLAAGAIKKECNEFEQSVIFSAINKIQAMINMKDQIFQKAQQIDHEKPFHNRIQKVTAEVLETMPDEDVRDLLTIFMQNIVFDIIEQTAPMQSNLLH